MSAILAGIPFDGLERGWEMTIDRHIEAVDVIGSRPRLVPLFPTAATDEFELTCEFWADSTYAALMESSLPPRGISGASSLLISAPLAAPSFPGFGTWSPDYWRLFGGVLMEPITSKGRKAVRANLFGYSMRLRFAANAYGQGGAAGNERTGSYPTSTTIPAILSRKFSSHQIQDPSTMRAPLPLTATSFPTVVHGVRRDATILLDHMTEAEATAVCNWFRAIRAAKFNLAHAELFGPGMASTVSAVATALTIRRATGYWFDGELSVSYAGAAS